MSEPIKVVNAIPVESQNNQYNIILSNNKITNCISYSYSVKIISFIQIFFNFLTAIYNPYLAFQIIFSVCGYHGAKTYNLCLSYVYFVHTILSFLSEIFFIYLVNIQNFPSYESRIFTNILFILVCICNLYIIRIIYRFILSLKNLTTNEITRIKNGVQITPVFMY